MEVEVEHCCLGEVDIQTLCNTIPAQDEDAWKEQLIRQQTCDYIAILSPW